jgi:hypothetical protein
MVITTTIIDTLSDALNSAYGNSVYTNLRRTIIQELQKAIGKNILIIDMTHVYSLGIKNRACSEINNGALCIIVFNMESTKHIFANNICALFNLYYLQNVYVFNPDKITIQKFAINMFIVMIKKDITCVICLDDMDFNTNDIIYTVTCCKNAFHKMCIKKIIGLTSIPCPTCRTTIRR